MADPDLETLIEQGEVRRCAACGELSAYAWGLVTEKPSYYWGCWRRGEIAHIGAACCYDWECGHCGASNAFADSPTLAEVYTHQPPLRIRRSFLSRTRVSRPLGAGPSRTPLRVTGLIWRSRAVKTAEDMPYVKAR